MLKACLVCRPQLRYTPRKYLKTRVQLNKLKNAAYQDNAHTFYELLASRDTPLEQVC
jgi:hypothetical protein